jgi:hypothetical protein
MKKYFVLTSTPDEKYKEGITAPNVGALAYASKLNELGVDVEYHDCWENSKNLIGKIRDHPSAVVAMFTGYKNIESTLRLKKNMETLGISVELCGRYDFIDGQNFSDTSLLQERGMVCKTELPYASKLDYDLISKESLSQLFRQQEENGMSKTLSILMRSGGCAKEINCLHCSSAKSYASERRYEEIISEISDLANKYAVKRVVVADLMLLEKNMCALAEAYGDEALSELKISSMANQITPKSVIALSRLNCKEVFLGVETYNDRLLKNLGKPFGTMQIDSALKSLYEANICANISVMLGISGENQDSLERTKKLILEWSDKKIEGKPFLKLQLSLTTPVPGSRIYAQLKDKIGDGAMQKIICSEDWIERLQEIYLKENFDGTMIKNIKSTMNDLFPLASGRYV